MILILTPNCMCLDRWSTDDCERQAAGQRRQTSVWLWNWTLVCYSPGLDGWGRTGSLTEGNSEHNQQLFTFLSSSAFIFLSKMNKTGSETGMKWRKYWNELRKKEWKYEKSLLRTRIHVIHKMPLETIHFYQSFITCYKFYDITIEKWMVSDRNKNMLHSDSSSL